MKIETIYYSSDFRKAFKRLPKHIQKKTSKKEQIFKNDCFDPQLKTHKLKGVLSNYWSFSIDYSYGIVFTFRAKCSAGFADIGTHSVYQ